MDLVGIITSFLIVYGLLELPAALTDLDPKTGKPAFCSAEVAENVDAFVEQKKQEAQVTNQLHGLDLSFDVFRPLFTPAPINKTLVLLKLSCLMGISTVGCKQSPLNGV